MQYLVGRFLIVKVLLGAFNKASPCTVKFREVRLTALSLGTLGFVGWVQVNLRHGDTVAAPRLLLVVEPRVDGQLLRIYLGPALAAPRPALLHVAAVARREHVSRVQQRTRATRGRAAKEPSRISQCTEKAPATARAFSYPG